jgi:hypothetical protein
MLGLLVQAAELRLSMTGRARRRARDATGAVRPMTVAARRP